MNPQLLNQLSILIAEVEETTEQIEKEEQRLAELKKEKETLVREHIPGFLENLGVTSLETSDGLSVDVRQFLSANIRANKRDEAFQWLEDTGNGDLVKHTITVYAPKGRKDIADAIVEFANQFPTKVDSKLSVHPQSFKKFARDWIADGHELPDDLISQFIWQEAIIHHVNDE